MAFFSRDLGVDLGTTNVLIYAEGKGIVLREPSVVAVDKITGKVLQVGSAARNMLGRTPGNVVAMRPLRGGRHLGLRHDREDAGGIFPEDHALRAGQAPGHRLRAQRRHRS